MVVAGSQMAGGPSLQFPAPSPRVAPLKSRGNFLAPLTRALVHLAATGNTAGSRESRPEPGQNLQYGCMTLQAGPHSHSAL